MSKAKFDAKVGCDEETGRHQVIPSSPTRRIIGIEFSLKVNTQDNHLSKTSHFKASVERSASVNSNKTMQAHSYFQFNPPLRARSSIEVEWLA